MLPLDYQTMMEWYGTVIPLAILMLESDEDRQFMTDVYIEYNPLMYKTAKKFFPANVNEMEDVVSNAVLNMCKYCSTVRTVPADRLPSYIVRIVRNACNARLKQVYASQNRNAYYANPRDLEHLEDEEAMHDVVLSKYNAIELLNSFQELKERDKELIRMRHIDMMDYGDIAKTLGISLSTARTAVFRAKQRLEKVAASLQEVNL